MKLRKEGSSGNKLVCFNDCFMLTFRTFHRDVVVVERWAMVHIFVAM